MGAVADGIRAAGGDRTAIYLTSRGITNEVYYAAAKAARAMGVANIDSAARTCHAPSTVGMRQTIGVAASTCSMQDVLDTDLVVLWGTNVANNQPVFTKYLYLARKPRRPRRRREPVPRARTRALLGAVERRVRPVRHEAVRPARAGPAGGRRGVRQRGPPAAPRADAVDREWVAAHTEGWDDLVAHLATLDRDTLLEQAGVDAATLDRFVDLYAGARGAVLVWSMGITQHTHGVDGVQTIVNVGLARGYVGRDERRADADPRALRRAGRRRDGRLRDGVPRRRTGRRRARRGLVRAIGLRRPRRRRA